MIKLFERKRRRTGFRFLNSAVALLAAASVAFLAFAMPLDLFSRIVAESGLPNLIWAAEPPLGMTARLVAVAAGAIITFFAVWALLRAFDRSPTSRPLYDAVSLTPEAPKLRRADLHPDAPPRPPLFASRDFGEPLNASATDEPFLTTDDHEPLELSLLASDPEPVPVVETAPTFARPSDPEPEIEAPLEIAPEPVVPEPVVEQPRKLSLLESLTAPLPDAADESVANLMRRLEGGLARREGAQSGDQTKEAPPTDQPAGHRLRSAINDLERMAKRG